MKIHWYWPFARPEELPLACAAARPDDELTVQVVNRDDIEQRAPCPRVTLLPNLPDVRRDLDRSPAWIASRALTYARRARLRSQAVDGADVCHIHYLNRFTDWALSRSAGRRIVMSIHDVVPHQSRLPWKVERTILQRTYSRAHALVVHHTSIRRELEERFEVDSSMIHVIPHQVFAYGDGTPPPPPPRGTVLFFGSLRSNKGIGVLVEAARSMPEDVEIVVAGRGDKRLERMLADAARYNPRIRVEIGYVSLDRKKQLFRDSAVVVLPYTQFSSQSGVLHDAYAFGRPVVAADVGALGATVKEDAAGVVVEPRDPTALANAVTTLVDDGERLLRLADRALLIRRERSPESLGPRIRSLYDEVSNS